MYVCICLVADLDSSNGRDPTDVLISIRYMLATLYSLLSCYCM